MRPRKARTGWNCLQLLVIVALANSVPFLVVGAAAGDDPPHVHTVKQPKPAKPAFLCRKKADR